MVKTGEYRYETFGNGTFVTLYAPDGATAFLQGEAAEEFLARAALTNEKFTDSDLVAEYDDGDIFLAGDDE